MQVYVSGILWQFEMYFRTTLAMLCSPIYSIKYVSCYYLQIKNNDGVQDFNHDEWGWSISNISYGFWPFNHWQSLFHGQTV